MIQLKAFLERAVKHAALLGLAFGVSVLAAQAQTFSPPKNLSNNAGFSGSPQIALDPGSTTNINVVWQDTTDSTPGNSAIFFSRSTDGGMNFSAPTNASNNTPSSGSPLIAVDSSGNINVVWVGSTITSGPPNIFFSRSTNGGMNFSAPLRLSPSMGDSLCQQIALDPGSSTNINVVWATTTIPFSTTVAFSRSTDGGVTFSAPKSLSDGMANCPQIALDSSNNINVVWGGPETFFGRSTDGGMTFSPPKNLSNNTGFSGRTMIALDPGSTTNINVVWEDSTFGALEILFSRSTDGGTNFSDPKNLSNNPGFSFAPQIAVDSSGNINVVWSDTTPPPPGNSDIFFSRSTDGGMNFSDPKNLSNNPGISGSPQIAVDSSGKINVLWADDTSGNSGILFSRSTDGGMTFSDPQNLSNHTGSVGPQIAVDSSGNINVVWQDNPSTPPQFDIFFSRATEAGPAVSLSPTSLSFGDQVVGITSDPQTVTLTNTGSATLNITSITLAGAAPGDYAFDPSTTCPLTGGPVAAGDNCLIVVTFTPTEAGARNASVSIADNAPGSPQTVPLSGNGIAVAPAVSLVPRSLDFGMQTVGTTSDPKIVTLSNTGSATQLTRLNTRPAHCPVNASAPPSRAAPHDSGPMWVANPPSYDFCIHHTSPV